jgi:hypothetical protein
MPSIFENRRVENIAAEQTAIAVDTQISVHSLKIINPLAYHQAIASFTGHDAPPCDENVVKALQRRSRIAQGLNVQNRVRLGLSLAAALLGRLSQYSPWPDFFVMHSDRETHITCLLDIF